MAPGDQTLLMKFQNRTHAFEMLAYSLARTIQAASSAHGAASVVVSGGESPRGLFELMRGLNLPWADVTVVPSDERWVETDSESSNEGMIRRHLLQGPAAAARLVGLYRPACRPLEAVPEVARELVAVKRPLDAVVLGMGADGHTASLFPGSPDIDHALSSHAPIVLQCPQGIAQTRISLTVRTLLDTHEVHLLFFGADKLATFSRAMRPGPAVEYPIRAIIHQTAVPVTAYWAP